MDIIRPKLEKNRWTGRVEKIADGVYKTLYKKTPIQHITHNILLNNEGSFTLSEKFGLGKNFVQDFESSKRPLLLMNKSQYFSRAKAFMILQKNCYQDMSQSSQYSDFKEVIDIAQFLVKRGCAVGGNGYLLSSITEFHLQGVTINPNFITRLDFDRKKFAQKWQDYIFSTREAFEVIKILHNKKIVFAYLVEENGIVFYTYRLKNKKIASLPNFHKIINYYLKVKNYKQAMDLVAMLIIRPGCIDFAFANMVLDKNEQINAIAQKVEDMIKDRKHKSINPELYKLMEKIKYKDWYYENTFCLNSIKPLSRKELLKIDRVII